MKRTLIAGVSVAAILVIAVAAIAARPIWAQTADDAAGALTAAQQKIRQLGAYRFTTHLIEIHQPAAARGAVSVTPTERHLHLEGSTDRDAGRFNMLVWDAAHVTYDPQEALGIKTQDGALFGRYHGGEWQQIEDLDGLATTADTLIYLDAAHHVGRVAGSETGGGDHLQFVIDSDKLSQAMRQQLQDFLHANGKLPAGVTLAQSSYYADTVATGELWLDADGLPQRLFISIEWPPARNGERVTALIQTDFGGYDADRLIPAFTADPAAWLAGTTGLALRRVDWLQIGGELALFAMALLAMLAFVLVGRRRSLYKPVAGVVALWLVLAPLSSAAQAQAIDKQLQEYAVLQGASATGGEPPVLTPVGDGAGGISAAALRGRLRDPGRVVQPVQQFEKPLDVPFDTSRSPMETGRAAEQVRQAATYIFDADAAAPASLAAAGDADEDGLDDSLEAIWGTSTTDPDSDDDGLTDGQEAAMCPNPAGGWNAENQADSVCARPTDADTDDDGLTDREEHLYLGTDANSADTDGDQIRDAVEVAGFLAGGVQRYTDPINPDTDEDSLPDGAECPQLAQSPYSGTCQDTDADGAPDVFDDDNDGDGIYNRLDSAPYTKRGNFNGANPFQFNVNNLQPDRTVLVDLQLNTVDPRHMGYAGYTLDWPSGDTQGQIQRRLDTTFPGTTGDVRVAPMLEMTFAPGAAPLPRTTAQISLTLTTFEIMGTVQLNDNEKDGRIDVYVPKLDTVNNATFSLGIYLMSCSTYRTVTTPNPDEFFPTVTANTSYLIPGKRLSHYADGKHVIVLKDTVANIAQCVPIEKLADNGKQLTHLFLRDREKLGDLFFEQAGANVVLTPHWEAASSQTDHTIEVRAGACDGRGAVVAPARVISRSDATVSLPNLTLTAIADGAHIMTVARGGREALCTTLPNIINGAPGETTMVDAVRLQQYNINVSEADTAGTLVASMPLITLTDTRSGRRSGFAGQMMFDMTGRTSLAAQTRMVWWVEMLTDNCLEPPADFMPGATYEARLRGYCGDGVDRPQLVHKYDDAWVLGGLSVREEHGLRVAVIYEDPATDKNLEADDYLWKLAKDLDEVFVDGVDCASGATVTVANCAAADGVVDLTVDGIAARTASWGYPANTFAVERHDYASASGFGEIPHVVLPNILQSRFMAGGKPKASAPLIMFAREEKLRVLDLETPGYATTAGSAVTLDFGAGALTPLDPVTAHALDWVPYRYKDGAWQGYTASDYLDLLEVRLRSASGFTAGDDEAALDEAAGKVRTAQTYFAYMMRGRSENVFTRRAIHFLNPAANSTITDATRAAQMQEAIGADGEADNGELISAVLNPIGEQLANNYHKFSRSMFKIDTEGLRAVVKLPRGRIFQTLGQSVRRQARSGFNQFSAHLTKTKFLKASATAVSGGIAIGAVAVDITGASGAVSEDNMFVAERVFEGLEIIIAVKDAAEALRDIRGAEQAVSQFGAGIGAAAAARAIATAATDVSKTAKYGGVVAAVVGEGIAWGMLIYTIAATDLDVGSLGANRLAADTASGSAIAISLAVIAATGPVGLAIAAVIGAIDAIIKFACAFLEKAQKESLAGEIVCTGISGWLAKAVAYVIYAANDMVTIADPYRLNTTRFDADLANQAAGFVPGAAMDLKVTMQNTLDLISTPPNIGATYAWQYDLDALKSSTFAYGLVNTPVTTEEDELHASLERGVMTADWQAFAPTDPSNRRHFITKSATGQFAIGSDAGPNRPVPAYLAEGYAIPVQECFLVPVPPTWFPIIPVCYVRSREDTNYTNLNLAMDILPTTLDGFFALAPDPAGNGQYRPAWGQTGELELPGLRDADGDGLAYDADVDDSTWDKDGDGIPDGSEIALKARPDSPDSDGDGLSDPVELIRGVDPLLTDTDLDGVSDGDELAGWTVGYGAAASAVTVIRSDPRQPDVDGDGILDGQEKIYGFNPRVANDRDVLAYQTDFTEPDAPLLHLPFEEPRLTTSFADTSGAASRQVASCVNNNAGTHLVIESVRSLNSFTTGIWLFFAGEGRNVDLTANGPATKVGAVAAVGQAPVTVNIEFVAFRPLTFTVNPATQARDLTYNETVTDQQGGFQYAAEIRYRLIERNFGCPQSASYGAFGNGLFFNGVGDHLRIVNHTAVNRLATHFTVGAWILPLTTAGRQTLLTTDRGLGNHGFFVALNGDALQFGFHNGPTFTSAAGAIQANQWQQVMVEVWDPNPIDNAYTTYFYVNGAGAGSAIGTQIGAPTPEADLLIGADIDQYSKVVDAFAGYLDDVVIYDFTAQDDANVVKGYNGTHNADDLVLRPGQRLQIDSTIQNQMLRRSLAGIHSIDFPPALTSAADQRRAFELARGAGLHTTDLIAIQSNAAPAVYKISQAVAGQVADRPDRIWKPLPSLAYQWNQTAAFNNASTLESDNPALPFSDPSNPNPGFTLSAWIKPTYAASDTQVRGVLGRNSGQASATPYLQTQGKNLIFGFGTGANHRQAIIQDKLTLNAWNFVAVRYAYAGAGQATFRINDFSGTSGLSSSGGPRDMSSSDSFFIGRSNNVGTATISRVKLICEGDGVGDGEYDIINLNTGGNHFRRDGSDGAEWANLGISIPVTDTATLTICEDDDGDHKTCTGADEQVGTLTFATNDATFGTKTVTNSYPANRSACAAESWYNWSWPDIVETDYSFTNESLPFSGEIQDVRIYTDWLSENDITALQANLRTVAQFNLDDPPRSSTFADYISYHQGTCNQGLGQCPLSGVEGRENLAADFDGINDGIDADTVSAEAAKGTALTMAAWVKADTTVGLDTILAFQDASNNLVNEIFATPVSGSTTHFQLWYHDQTMFPVAAPGSNEIGKWHRVVVTIGAGNNGRIYVNHPSAFTAFNTGSRPTSNGRFRIGYRVLAGTPKDFFDGQIDNVLVEKVAWDENDIKADLDRVPAYRNSFEDAQVFGSNPPLAGLEGQVGRAFEFDGVNDELQLGQLSRFISGGNLLKFSLGLWVKGENFDAGVGTTERVLFGGSLTTTSLPYRRSWLTVSLDKLGRPTLWIKGEKLTGDLPITPNVWTHLAFTVDDVTGGDSIMKLYVNGAFSKQRTFPPTDTINPVNVDAIFGYAAGGTTDAHFDGRMDEFFFYRSALTDRQILELYNIQNAWVGENDVTEVTVAAVPPAVALELDRSYLPNAVSPLLITTAAQNAPVIHASLVVNGGTLYAAPAAAESQFGSAFVANFVPPGEGAYTMQATAVDAVGNQAAYTPAKTVFVDGTAPLPVINVFPTPLTATPHPTDAGKYRLSFSGTVADPAISGTAQPGSGVESLGIYLVDAGAKTIVNGTQMATLAGNQWTVGYEVISDNPTGEYELYLAVADKVGNRTDYRLSTTLKIDTTAPAVKVSNISTPTTAAGAGAPDVGAESPRPDSAAGNAYLNGQSVIAGTADETPVGAIQHSTFAGIQAVQTRLEPLFEEGSPFVNRGLPAGARLYLPLDESEVIPGAANDRFADLVAGLTATCSGATCPASGAAGKVGNALAFDGVNDQLSLGHVPAIGALTNNFTVAAWVKPRAATAWGRIISTSRANSNDGFGFGLTGADGLIFTTYGIQDYMQPYSFAVNTWYHVAAVMGGDNAVTFYVNGIAIGTVAGANPGAADPNDALIIGSLDGLEQFFDGLIDDVAVVAAALPATGVRELMGMAPALHLTFDAPSLTDGQRLDDAAGLGSFALLDLETSLNAANRSNAGVVGQSGMTTAGDNGNLVDRINVTAAQGALPAGDEPYSIALWAMFDTPTIEGTITLGNNSFSFGASRMATSWPSWGEQEVALNLALQTWHHLVWTYDSDQRVLYVDGAEVTRDDPTEPNTLAASGELNLTLIGWAGGADDLTLYRRALVPLEIAALAKTGWRTAALTPGPTAETGAWTTSPPAGLEGFYALRTRAADNLLNHADDLVTADTWRGMVDSLAPRTTYSTTPAGAARTYTFEALDFNLEAATLVLPPACVGQTTITTERYASPWYLALANQAAAGETQLNQRDVALKAVCAVSQPLNAGVFSVCDAADNCVALNWDGTPGTAPPRSKKVFLPLIGR